MFFKRPRSFRNNHALNDIKLQAFSGIEHLSVLVLNNTAVSDLPTHGLGEVTELHISRTCIATENFTQGKIKKHRP